MDRWESENSSFASARLNRFFRTLLPELIELARAIDGLAPEGAVERD